MKHNKNLTGILIAMLFSVQLIVAQINDDETNFYTEVSNANFDKNLISDYGVDNDFSTDDSVKFQQSIEEIPSNGGGTLIVEKGNYSLSEIFLKSNVHIVIDSEAVIRPSFRNNQKNYSIFKLGSGTGPIENVSIRGENGTRVNIDLTQNNNPNVSVFNCGNVFNFMIANFVVEDDYTKFSVVTMGGDFYNDVYAFPKNGIVKNIHNLNAHYGYGVVQTQSASNILFKDLHGLGGATLRMETGYTGLNNLQVVGEPRVGGIDKLVGRNISCTNGNSAVMISPHAMHNGSVDVEGVVSNGAGFAVRVEGGFVSNKYDQTIGLIDGTFESVRIKDVKATFGNQAELKSKHFGYYPSEIEDPTAKSSYDSDIYIGPSIAAVLNDANYQCNKGKSSIIIEDPIDAIGFEFQEPIIPEEFVNYDCSSYESIDNFSMEIKGETCVNKNNGSLVIKTKTEENYILNFNNKEYNFTKEFKLENITPGNYLACIIVKNKDFEQCFNIQIDEVPEISGKSSSSFSKTAIEIFNGTKPFSVFVNGKEEFKTYSNNIEINSKNGDLIEVKSAKECEGVFSEKIKGDYFVSIYPNPASSFITVISAEIIKKIELFSSSGTLVKKFSKSNTNNVDVDISSLNEGFYFLKMTLGEKVITKKIIIQ